MISQPFTLAVRESYTVVGDYDDLAPDLHTFTGTPGPVLMRPTLPWVNESLLRDAPKRNFKPVPIVKPFSDIVANRKRLIAETARLTDKGWSAGEIAVTLKVSVRSVARYRLEVRTGR